LTLHWHRAAKYGYQDLIDLEAIGDVCGSAGVLPAAVGPLAARSPLSAAVPSLGLPLASLFWLVFA